MSKGLEALNKIKTQSLNVVEVDKCLSIIEKELKRLEKYDEIVRNNIKVYKKYLYTNNSKIYACRLIFKGYEYTINEELYLFLKGAFKGDDKK